MTQMTPLQAARIRERLEPCPFCGEPPNVLTALHPTLLEDGYYIECRDMGCILRRCGGFLNPDDLIREWNKRSA